MVTEFDTPDGLISSCGAGYEGLLRPSEGRLTLELFCERWIPR